MRIVTDKIKLNIPCKAVDYKQSKKIANEMIMFMLSHKNISNNSVGLACNQLGLDGRVIIVKIKNKWVRFINPLITYKSQEKIITEESCLSIPKKTFKIERAKDIAIYFEKGNPNGNYGQKSNFSNGDAIVIQHEIDHLNGILISDKENNND